MLKYFEEKCRGGRWVGYDAAYPLHNHGEFADVWSRFAERWNEVELNSRMPLSLHDQQFEGAATFDCAMDTNSVLISHANWQVIIFFRRGYSPWLTTDLSCGRKSASASDIATVVCHYRRGHREDVHAWLTAEYKRFAKGQNSYDTVLNRQLQVA